MQKSFNETISNRCSILVGDAEELMFWRILYGFYLTVTQLLK